MIFLNYPEQIQTRHFILLSLYCYYQIIYLSEYHPFVLLIVCPLRYIKLLTMPSQPTQNNSNIQSTPPTTLPPQVSPSQSPNELAAETSPMPPSQQSATTYLKKLLQRHTAKADFVYSFTADKEQQCEEEIISGRYSIHKREWSAQEEKLKASRADPSRNTADILHAKRQLEDQLEMIEGEIQDNQRGGKGMSEEERKAFLKRMEKQRKELLRKKEENAKLLQQKRAEEERKERQQQQREENERKAKKQQQIAERMKALEEARKRKEEQFKSQTVLLKQKMKEKTTANKIQQNYNLKQNETLQERKKRLAEIRMLHKPIDRKELDAHAEKLQQLHAERAAALAAAQAQKPIDKPTVAFYKSIFYKRVKDEPKVFLDKQSEDEVGKLRQNRDKLKKFAQHIRENYKPTIDEKKAEEIKFRSVNFRNRSMSSVKAKDNDPQKLGLRYLEYSKQQVDHQRLLCSQREESQEEKPKKLDYLAQLRKANKNRASESAHDLLNKLGKGSVTKEEKMKKILEFTDRIEKTAKRKEQLSKISSGGVDDELDALYLEAIQAKLGLLQDY